ncbi:MAG: glycosyltransferase [Candidatus Woesearchaeota archaeon]
MRVCLVSSYPPKQSGIGTYTSYLAKELGKIDTVDVLPWNYDGFFSKLLSPFTNIRRLSHAFLNYDIVHIQYHLGDFLFFFLPVLFFIRGKAKLVITLHEDYANLVFAPLVKLFHNIVYHRADLLIAHTAFQQRVLSASLVKKSTIIPHGIILRKVKRNPKKGNILLPGFINPWKGHDLAIRALSFVVKTKPKVRLIIAGKAHHKDYAEKLRSLVKELSLERNVTINDKYIEEKNLFALFRNSEIAVLPYRRITMSGIFCHVVSWNLPCVLSDLVPFREYTQGMALYFRSDDYLDLAEKILALLGNKALQKRMSHDFLKLSSQYSWSSVAQMTHYGYQRLV